MYLQDLSEYGRVVIWGAGKELQRYKKQFHVDYIVDSDTKKVGGHYCGVPIKSVFECINDCEHYRTLIVISSTKYRSEIKQNIKSLGLQADVAELDIICAIMYQGGQSFALWGLDVLVKDLFLRGGYDLSELSYIEVGACHPIWGSVTAIMNMAGARGILIEPNPDLQESLRTYRDDQILMCGIASKAGKLKFYRFDNVYRNTFDETEALDAVRKGFVKKDEIDVEVKTLEKVIADSGMETEKALLSIQAMGLETEILKTFDHKKYNFPIITLAYYSDEVFRHPMFRDYYEIARVPRHVVLVNQRIYKQILG